MRQVDWERVSGGSNYRNMFITVSIVLRLIAGVGSALMHVSVYAMAAIKWPEDVQQKIGILEAASGAGIFVGPVLGSALYDASGIYCIPFFVFAGMLLITAPMVMINLDKTLDTDREIKETEMGEDGIMK